MDGPGNKNKGVTAILLDVFLLHTCGDIQQCGHPLEAGKDRTALSKQKSVNRYYQMLDQTDLCPEVHETGHLILVEEMISETITSGDDEHC